MKHFILLKLAVPFLGIAAALVLTPVCKAQSEISPDHFDGTDSWATAAQPKHAPLQGQPVAKPSLRAKGPKSETKGSAFQLAAAREVAKPVRREAAAIDRKRTASTPNSDKP